MYFFLILFSISLLGIIVMIGQKLLFANIKNNSSLDKIFEAENFDIEEIKHATIKSVKRYGFIGLVIILRFSIKFSFLIKNFYRKVVNKIKSIINIYFNNTKEENKEKEVSNFLKMVSDYKHKIRQIKHRIKEEEGIR